MTSKLKHFLLVFDHQAGRLIERDEFADNARAVAAYSAEEREYSDRPSIETVLIGSDSFDTIRFTHANYFDGSVALSKYLVGLEQD